MIDPAALRSVYLEKFAEFCQTLRERALAMEADYHKVSTAVPHDRTLLDYLAARSRRGRSGTGGGR